MRTNIVIDDNLMREALQASGARTKKAVVELGLQALIRQSQQRTIRKYRGAFDLKGNLDVLRSDA